jgi:hypothetical protein
MKKLLLFLLLPMAFNAQVVGTWKLANQAAAMGVGPSQGSMQWWSNGVGDLTTRACMFDDSITFNANGTMMHVERQLHRTTVLIQPPMRITEQPTHYLYMDWVRTWA